MLDMIISEEEEETIRKINMRMDKQKIESDSEEDDEDDEDEWDNEENNEEIDQDLDQVSDTYHEGYYCSFKRKSLHFFERYLIYLQRLKKIKQQIFKNHEIIYKKLVRKLIEKRNWNSIQEKLEEFIGKNDWNELVSYLETRPFGKSESEICQLKIYDRTLVDYLLCARGYCFSIFQKLSNEFHAPILYKFTHKVFKYYIKIDINTFMECAVREIEETRGKTIGNDILVNAFSDFIFSESNVDTLIDLIKRYRMRDYRPKFLKRFIHLILKEICENYQNFALKVNYLVNKLKVVESGICKREHISDCIVEMFDKFVGSIRFCLSDYKRFMKEMEEMARLGLASYFDKLPEPLVSCNDNTVSALRLLVEVGIDLRKYPYLIYQTLKTGDDCVKTEMLKFLIDDCKLDYKIPEGKEELTFDRLELNTPTYLIDMQYLSSKLNLKLTTTNRFLMYTSAISSYTRYSTLVNTLDWLIEKFDIDIKEEAFSLYLPKIYRDWKKLAVKEDSKMQSKVKEYVNLKFPHINI